MIFRPAIPISMGLVTGEPRSGEVWYCTCDRVLKSYRGVAAATGVFMSARPGRTGHCHCCHKKHWDKIAPLENVLLFDKNCLSL